MGLETRFLRNAKSYLYILKARRSETTKVVKVALYPDPIKSVKAPERLQ